MKRSGPLLILVALTLATLSYGGKQAQDRPPVQTVSLLENSQLQSRIPASVFEVRSEAQLPLANTPKNEQHPVVIAESPPLEIEEIH